MAEEVYCHTNLYVDINMEIREKSLPVIEILK